MPQPERAGLVTAWQARLAKPGGKCLRPPGHHDPHGYPSPVFYPNLRKASAEGWPHAPDWLVESYREHFGGEGPTRWVEWNNYGDAWAAEERPFGILRPKEVKW